MAKGAGAKPKKKVKWLRYVLLGLAGLAVYHIMTGPSGAVNLLQLKRENAEKRHELDSLRARKVALEVEKVRLEKDSAYLERVARKELGMAKPDEKVFRFMKPENPGE
jgi:cell division protein FtsB